MYVNDKNKKAYTPYTDNEVDSFFSYIENDSFRYKAVRDFLFGLVNLICKYTRNLVHLNINEQQFGYMRVEKHQHIDSAGYTLAS